MDDKAKSSAKKRIAELEEMIQIVLLAIPREISAREFYLAAVKKATSQEAGKLFTDLAEQEKGHEIWLRKILAELRGELGKLK